MKFYSVPEVGTVGAIEAEVGHRRSHTSGLSAAHFGETPNRPKHVGRSHDPQARPDVHCPLDQG